MKKKLIAVLTGALLIGGTIPAFAQTNIDKTDTLSEVAMYKQQGHMPHMMNNFMNRKEETKNYNWSDDMEEHHEKMMEYMEENDENFNRAEWNTEMGSHHNEMREYMKEYYDDENFDYDNWRTDMQEHHNRMHGRNENTRRDNTRRSNSNRSRRTGRHCRNW